jgi:hypothetical protein
MADVDVKATDFYALRADEALQLAAAARSGRERAALAQIAELWIRLAGERVPNVDDVETIVVSSLPD